MSTRYNRRQAINLGLSSMAGLALWGLAGCDSSTPGISTNQEDIAMRMFFWGSSTRSQLTNGAIKLFHQSNPTISVTASYTGNDTYYTQLDKQIASGKAPDLIQMDMRYIARYVREGALVELSQLIYNQTIDLSDFNAVQVTSSKVNNGIYGISLGSNYPCMFYDQKLLSQANFAPPTLATTWDDFSEYAIELTKALNGTIYGTSDSSGNYDNFEVWIRTRGKDLYTVTGDLAFDLGDVGDWFSYWEKLRQAKGCLPAATQAALDITGTPTDSSVIKGKAVFSHVFSNQYIAYQAATSHPLTLAAYPKGSTPGMYIKASQLLSISTQTPHTDAAAEFVNFFVTNPQAVKELGFERGVPASTAALAYLQPSFTAAEKTIVDFMDYVSNAGATRVKVVLDPPGAGAISTLLQTIALQIGEGKVSVTDGSNQFYIGAKKLLIQSA